MGPPSAVRPRSTAAKAHSARDVAAGVRQREVHPEAVVAEAVVVELDVHPHEVLAGAQLEGGADLHRAASPTRRRPSTWVGSA